MKLLLDAQEKVLAARRAGIHTVILPKQNEKHVKEDLTDELRRGLTVHCVSEMDEVLALALTPKKVQPDHGLHVHNIAARDERPHASKRK